MIRERRWTVQLLDRHPADDDGFLRGDLQWQSGQENHRIEPIPGFGFHSLYYWIIF